MTHMTQMTQMTHANALRRAAIAPIAAITTLAGLAMSPSAHAQAFDAVRLYGAAPDKDGGNVGLALINGRKYSGSDERRTMLVPGLDYIWSNGWFAGTANGVGYNFSSQPFMSYGLRLTADFGRSESRSRFLKGMGNVDAAAEVGGFLNYSINRAFVLTSSLRYGAGVDRNGMLLDLGAVYSTEVAPRWRLGLGAATTYANASYQQSYFGVTSRQAITSGYAAYTPGAGLRDLRLNVSLAHGFSERVGVFAALSAGRLLGDAKSSPLTREASSMGLIAAVTYSF
jgi:outer membrane scaffolding protein for murein synthesis (MipA/OmpV family)